MEKGINLSLTKSLADFDALLIKAIEAVPSKKLSVTDELNEVASWEFQVGKYIEISSGDEEGGYDEEAFFWIGYGWEENEKRESILWLEFDAKTCPALIWEKVNSLVGTSGKYYSKADFEFAQIYMNAWVHFYLNEECLKQFYDEKADPNKQKEILTGFVNEIMEKI